MQQRYVDHYRDYINDAKKHGTLSQYDPYVWRGESVAPQLYELHALVAGQEGIKEYLHDGCSGDFFDEKILGFYASMPDLESMELQNTTLIGDAFAPFAKDDSQLHSLDLRNCGIKYEAYRSIGKVKSLKTLMILAPLFIDADDEQIRQKGPWTDDKHSLTSSEAAEIAKIIAGYTDCKNLEKLTLDSLFLPWKEEIQENFPNAHFIFGKRSDYDGELEIEYDSAEPTP